MDLYVIFIGNIIIGKVNWNSVKQTLINDGKITSVIRPYEHNLKFIVAFY